MTQNPSPSSTYWKPAGDGATTKKPPKPVKAMSTPAAPTEAELMEWCRCVGGFVAAILAWALMLLPFFLLAAGEPSP